MTDAFDSARRSGYWGSIPSGKWVRSWAICLGILVGTVCAGGTSQAQTPEAPVVVIRTLPDPGVKPAAKRKPRPRSTRKKRVARVQPATPASDPKVVASTPTPSRRTRRTPRAKPAEDTTPRVAETSSTSRGPRRQAATERAEAPTTRSEERRTRRTRRTREASEEKVVASSSRSRNSSRRREDAPDRGDVQPKQTEERRTRRKRGTLEETEKKVVRESPGSKRAPRSSRRAEPELVERKRETRRETIPATTTSRTARSLNAEGYALLRRGRYSEAEEPLRAAVRMKSNYGYALYNLGWSLLAQGKAREAIEPLREAAALQPTRWEPLQKLSEAYSQIGNRDLAFEARAKARELKGDRRDRRTRSNPVRGAQLAVRTMLGDAAWVGSTNQREDQYLQERQEYQLGQTAKADNP